MPRPDGVQEQTVYLTDDGLVMIGSGCVHLEIKEQVRAGWWEGDADEKYALYQRMCELGHAWVREKTCDCRPFLWLEPIP